MRLFAFLFFATLAASSHLAFFSLVVALLAFGALHCCRNCLECVKCQCKLMLDIAHSFKAGYAANSCEPLNQLKNAHLRLLSPAAITAASGSRIQSLITLVDAT